MDLRLATLKQSLHYVHIYVHIYTTLEFLALLGAPYIYTKLVA